MDAEKEGFPKESADQALSVGILFFKCYKTESANASLMTCCNTTFRNRVWPIVIVIGDNLSKVVREC